MATHKRKTRMTLEQLQEQHQQTLAKAVAANSARTFHAHWPEAPSGKIYGETANTMGEVAFKGQLDSQCKGLLQDAIGGWVGQESSPYGFPLGITYPTTSVDDYISRASSAQVSWQSVSAEHRALVLIEALECVAKRFFEIGYATMHTTGQGFVMAFQASGPHAADRALEALSMGYSVQSTFTDSVQWTKPMGKISVTINKKYRIVPKGINLVIGCSTFPTWNSVPGMFAGLVTGNSVLIKAHPGAVYPMAIYVAEVQATLNRCGFDPHICQLVVDTTEKPLTLDLLRHPAVAIIDYTGGPAFGAIVEKEALVGGKVVFTEKAGVNTVIIDSTENVDAMLENLAFSLSLYGGQMCTAPQNIFVCKDGVATPEGLISVEDIALKLREKIDGLVGNEKMGPGTVGAIQNAATAGRVEEAAALGLPIIRASAPIPHAGFNSARSVSPLVLRTDVARSDIYTREWFGPISFIISTDSFEDSLTEVTNSIKAHGALTTLVYTTDPEKMERAEGLISRAGAPVAFNFNSYVWVNQSAAFSDFHGSGANPAGNATFADVQFVASRFNVIGIRTQA